MQELIERLKACDAADRLLDRDIGLYLDGWLATVDEFGDALMVNGDRYPDHPGAEYPSFTGSLDDAFALAESFWAEPKVSVWRDRQSAPGWSASVSVGQPYQAVFAPTPALALCIAILKARSTTV